MVCGIYHLLVFTASFIQFVKATGTEMSFPSLRTYLWHTMLHESFHTKAMPTVTQAS